MRGQRPRGDTLTRGHAGTGRNRKRPSGSVDQRDTALQVTGDGHRGREFGFRPFGIQPRDPGCRWPKAERLTPERLMPRWPSPGTRMISHVTIPSDLRPQLTYPGNQDDTGHDLPSSAPPCWCRSFGRSASPAGRLRRRGRPFHFRFGFREW